MYSILKEKAENGFEQFINYIRDDRNLLYGVDEIGNETEIEVETFDDNMCTEIVGTYYFDKVGNFIRSI